MLYKQLLKYRIRFIDFKRKFNGYTTKGMSTPIGNRLNTEV